MQAILGTKADEISFRVNHLIEERKELEKKLKHKRSKSSINAKTLMEECQKYNDYNLFDCIYIQFYLIFTIILIIVFN